MNWIYNGKEITSSEQLPEGCIGFIYLITNLTSNKIYYGRKMFRSLTKKRLTKKEKQLPENRRKTFKYVYVEKKDWITYTGSCIPLNNDIENGDSFKKEILRCCFSKSEMTYYETKFILCSDCLEREDCYNNHVLGKIFYKTKDE